MNHLDHALKAGNFILGAGVTGLAAGLASGWPIFEANEHPGGICSTYYLGPGESKRRAVRRSDEEDYRFEVGGGHWLFGADEDLLHQLSRFAEFRRYNRRSAVFFPARQLLIPYPLQYHLSFLPQEISMQALNEIQANDSVADDLHADWLKSRFGRTLCELFFDPFHHLYTAGLSSAIAPDDGYKSPVDMERVLSGLKGTSEPGGYNAIFVYPKEGLGTMFHRMANRCNVSYGKRVASVNVDEKLIRFADGNETNYNRLISTLPLNQMLELCRLKASGKEDPHTSVLVLNVGAVKGDRCPPDHWIYVPTSKSGFHRVGFYSNVDAEFLPRQGRISNNKVGLYVERAFVGQSKPSQAVVDGFVQTAITELQDWGFIASTEVVDATWVEVAYTWRYPGSTWAEEGINLLNAHDIHQVGRYGRWHFQGIAASYREGGRVGQELPT